MRVDNLRQKMAEVQLDGFLVTQPENRRYLSGFSGSAGVLVVSAARHGLATDSRYYEQVRQQCPDWELLEVGYGFTKAMPQLLADFGLAGKRVGFEAADVSVAALQAWQESLDGQAELVPTEGAVESLRMRKEPAELAAMQKAIALADEAYMYIAEYIEPGMTELEVAWALESYMRTHGAQALSFESIVASGPNSAKPHAHPSGRKISAGEPITLDFGCVVDGYCSDITRSFCLDAPAGERYLEVWNTVRQAQQAAIDGARAGMSGAAVDALARDVINRAGYGDYFGHGLGHSLGLAVHENPRYSFTYQDEVPAGAVMTVEPGIYIPGWGGVRLEDVVLVEENGVRLLSAAPKVAVI
ncbi:MAG: aminopeptidase P family protein [Chloroflexi bacterium]|nr:MAG: aminopeptidase P family protein [Chloroflexota bacterium]